MLFLQHVGPFFLSFWFPWWQSFVFGGSIKLEYHNVDRAALNFLVTKMCFTIYLLMQIIYCVSTSFHVPCSSPFCLLLLKFPISCAKSQKHVYMLPVGLLSCLGSPVLGYLAAGILIGPYGLSIIRHVHGTKAIAEFGVVFLLFNIGLEVKVMIAV